MIKDQTYLDIESGKYPPIESNEREALARRYGYSFGWAVAVHKSRNKPKLRIKFNDEVINKSEQIT